MNFLKFSSATEFELKNDRDFTFIRADLVTFDMSWVNDLFIIYYELRDPPGDSENERLS